MADLELRIEAFVKLGNFFREFYEYNKNGNEQQDHNAKWFLEFNEKITMAKHQNGWFTKENILFAMAHWGNVLTVDKLEGWLANYPLENIGSKKIALIMAGNIPMVGFHDFLATLITGNRAFIKLSSNDTILLPLIAAHLIELEPSFTDKIIFSDGKLQEFDAVIATGSNNTARYFEHYFGKKPHIIRKNRNSVAVLTGRETTEQLSALGEDIFRYYGLGCRSVSKLFVPKGYDFDDFFKAIYAYAPLIEQQKYANNYDYNKAVYLMSEFDILENGFLMLKEDTSYASPIATLFYEHYDSLEDLHGILKENEEKLQCIVSENIIPNTVPFGKTQKPGLTEYADGVDTVEFLLKT
ncbi:MAG: acyl-CoA reductase [Bacteroidota bacterium]